MFLFSSLTSSVGGNKGNRSASIVVFLYNSIKSSFSLLNNSSTSFSVIGYYDFVFDFNLGAMTFIWYVLSIKFLTLKIYYKHISTFGVKPMLLENNPINTWKCTYSKDIPAETVGLYIRILYCFQIDVSIVLLLPLYIVKMSFSFIFISFIRKFSICITLVYFEHGITIFFLLS